MLKSKIFKIFLLLILGIGIWYFLLKDYNYRVTFKTDQAPGIVYAHLTEWNNGETPNNKVVTILNKSPFSEIEQHLKVGDSLFKIIWNLERSGENETTVIAKFKDENNSFKQNIQALYSKNDFVQRSIATVRGFGEGLIENAKNYKVSDVEEAMKPAQNCAFIQLECAPKDKASAMVKNIHVVMNYLKDNDLLLTGSPFLEVKEWDMENEKIKFDFCFPIMERQTYPPAKSVRFKKTKEQKSLKTIFNGNYRISDRAWFVLLDYAEQNNIDIEMSPVEFYLNDPHNAGNSLEWVAEVYMPIKLN